MAALTRHGFLGDYLWNNRFVLVKCTVTAHWNFVRGKKARCSPKVTHTFKAAETSLASKGYLHSRKEYHPSNDVAQRFDDICKKQGISTANNFTIDDPHLRFNLFVACSEEFDHSLPNSMMHTIDTIGNLREFYNTPVYTTTPLDKIRNTVELPKNLHVLYDYHRFHPDTDTMFAGKTAFPKSSTIVTSLKHKKKYRNYIIKPVWDTKV